VKIRINETFIFKETISFSIFNKKIVNLEIDPNESIFNLKKRILEKYKLSDHPELFKIIYKNREIDDSKRIRDLDIKENTTLHIICRDAKKLDEILRNKGLL
jgi:hypothetical protein